MLTRTPRSIRTGNRGCRFRFHSAIVHRNDIPSQLRRPYLRHFILSPPPPTFSDALERWLRLVGQLRAFRKWCRAVDYAAVCRVVRFS
jgi:hypothetical protein